MGYVEDRDNARVLRGEGIVAVIEEALRVRDHIAVPPIERPMSGPYRDAMMALDDAFRQIARDEIDQREMDLSYDG